MKPGEQRLKNASGHFRTNVKSRLVPKPIAHDLRQCFHGIPDIDMAEEQRRESKPDGVGCSEIRLDAPLGERAHDRITCFMTQADMTAPRATIRWRSDIKAERLRTRDAEITKTTSLLVKIRNATPFENVERS